MDFSHELDDMQAKEMGLWWKHEVSQQMMLSDEQEQIKRGV